MRHSIKRVGKRTLSIVLTLMMLVSTMVVGMVTFNAAAIPKNTTIYLDLSNASGFKKDSNPIYLAVTASSNSDYSADNLDTSGAGSYKPASDKWYTMSNVSGNIWSATVTEESTVGKVSFFSDNESGYDNVYSTNCTLGRTYDGTNNMFVIGSSTYHNDRKSNIYGGSWSTYSGGSGGDTVTGDLLSVLKGEKVMFYAGEPSGWNQSTIYLYTGSGQSGDSVSKSGVSNGLSGYVLGAFCVAPDINYYVGHDKYAPYSVKPTAGAAYVLSGDESSSSGFTKISTNSSGNSLYSLNKGATLTATTTCDSSIQAGSSLNVNTSTAAGKSTIGLDNTIEYYIGDSAGNYSKYSLSNGTLDTSELADGTYTLKTVLSDGNIYVVGDTDTFTVESTQTLPAPGLATTDKGIITSDKPVTLTISNGSVFPDGTTFSLVNASGNTVKALTSGNNTLEFSDTDIPSEEGTYTVVASCDGYKSSSSDEITLKKVQVYGVTLAVNDDADVSATFINAYGQSDTITEGMVTPVPAGNKVTVTATVTDTANKAFSKFTYGGKNYENNPAEITITENDGVINTVINDVEKRTVKIAAIEYVDKDNHTATDNYLGTNDLTYTFAGSSKTVTMTACADDSTAYFVVPSSVASEWNGNGHKFYIYEAQVPSTVTSLRLDDKVDISLDSTTEYYAVFNYSGWKSSKFMTADRYYKVDVVADKSIDSGAAVSANGTASVNYASNNAIKLYKNQSNITLTATPSNTSAFSLERWNDGTTDITSPYTVVGEATLTAYFKANQTYTINLVNTDANLDSITSSPASQTYESNTVKVTVKAKTGYECSGLTVKTASGENVTVTDNKDGTYSFTMPGEDVTVTPTITAKQAANVTVSSNDDTRGTATLTTTGTIYVGDSFTVKAAPKSDNTFKDFTVTGATQVGTVKNADGSTTGTFKATEQNVTVTANFEENSGVLQTEKYLLYQYNQNDANPALLNKYLPVYLLSDGTFVARFSEDEVKAMRGKDCHFALSKTSSYNESNIYWTNNNNVTVTKDPSDTTLIYANHKTYNDKFHLGQFYYDNDQVVGIEIEVGKDDGKGNVQYPNYVVRPIVEQLPEGTVTVYAKDGTTVDGGTFDMAETRVLSGYDKILSENADDRYCKYRASKDGYLAIETTMTADRLAQGYYVYAFNINGMRYPALEIRNGVYRTNYAVEGDEVNVEITPIFYNKTTEENGDYITVYLDASELDGRWGNTIACYSYYYNDTDLAYETSKYPGQPMLLGPNGLYYTRVPRYAYSNGEKRVDGDGNPYPVSGVTFNSFTEGGLHHSLYPEIEHNYQTYDYDEFKYIADLGYDTVRCEIRYRTSTTNQLTLLNNANDAPNKPGTNIDPATYEAQNGWNNLFDYDRNLTDILGNRLTDEQKKAKPLHVVAVGNQSTSVGKWSTVWYVYDQNGDYVTKGVPSDFIPRVNEADNTTAYKAIQDRGLTGLPVKVTFESEQGAGSSVDSGNSGYRCSARWLYTNSDQEATVDVSVQYRNNASSDWTSDTNESSTAVSGLATIDGVTSKTFENRNVTAQLNAVPKNGYVFVEWGTVDDEGNYSKLENIKSAASEFIVNNNQHLVARFEKVEGGSLVLTHRKYNGPDAVGGNGAYLIAAVVKDEGGEVLASFPADEYQIIIPNIQQYLGCDIEITMTTKMRGINTFIDWYMLTPEGDYDNITQSEDVWGKTGEVSQTIVQSVNDLYSGSALVVNALHYYSDIARVTRKAILNYKYYNRFNEVRTYTKPVDLDDEYIDTNGYTITDKLIYDNAPAIEDLYKDCVWTITDQTTTKNGTTATIWGTHTGIIYDVNLIDGDNPVVTKKVEYNNYLKNDNNEFYTAPNTNEMGIPFAYWLVENKDGKEVARCYANEFNLKIVDHYTITAVYEGTRESSLTISEPKYTREQFTDESGNVTSDYLYVDFIVAYMNSNGILLNGDLASTMNYHTGLIVEFDRDIKVSDVDAANATLSRPLTEYTYNNSTYIETLATDESIGSGSLKIDPNDDTRALYKFEINNADYNNKNRIDYFVKFENKKSFKHYVMKAYYYVYYTDADGNVVEYKQTAPQYFCLFEIGNSTAETNNNNSSETA